MMKLSKGSESGSVTRQSRLLLIIFLEAFKTLELKVVGMS